MQKKHRLLVVAFALIGAAPIFASLRVCFTQFRAEVKFICEPAHKALASILSLD
jgi:hypothetical protein